MEAEEYVHTPLDDASAQIRLLKIVPRADESQRLYCELGIYAAQEAAKLGYTALSYTWGNPTPSQQIYVDGRTIEVRQNLYDFLFVAARDEGFCQTTLLWIDQICIDQSNDDEKQKQVSRMDWIYRAAQGVIIWLGTGFPGSDELIHYTNLASSNMSIHMHPEMLDYWATLVQLPYWTRLWICQEVVLAKIITLWIGRSRIVWGQFQHHADENDLLTSISKRDGAEHGAGCLRRLVDVRMAQKDLAARGQLGWVQALEAQRGSICFLRYDKIFGLLGLVWDDLKVEVDYQIPMRDLFFQVLHKHVAYVARQSTTLSWIPFLNSLAHFTKDLRYEMGLKDEITDIELGAYLNEQVSRYLLKSTKSLGWHKYITYPWHAYRIRRWSKTFSSIRYIEGFDWNNYNAQPDDWKAFIPEELR